jgi:site-specific DNA-methyltransferase (adenine-specific)
MNLRKAGDLGIRTTCTTSFDDDDYRFGAEIAIRLLERRDGVTLDDVLCDPALAGEFDGIAETIAPGFTALKYRWAALSLRKQRELEPEVASRILAPEDAKLVKLTELRLQDVPQQPGVYVFVDVQSKQALYVGEASNLRQRLGKHVDHSDNKMLAQHLWQEGCSNVVTEYYVLPAGTSKRELRAIESEQIKRRNPRFNIAGRM